MAAGRPLPISLRGTVVKRPPTWRRPWLSLPTLGSKRQDRPNFLAKRLVRLRNSDSFTDEKSSIYARLSTAPLKLSSRFVAPSSLI